MANIRINLMTGDYSRISKSMGCQEAKKIDGIDCLKETFIPIEPWIGLEKTELESLIAKSDIQYTDLTLIKLPKFIKKSFEKLKIDNCINIHDISYIQNSVEFKRTLQTFLNHLERYNIEKKQLTPHSIYFGKPNLKNNTFNSKENVYIGMHLDSWEGDPLNLRSKSRNRICLNLGKKSRYLLFYNIGLDDMAKMADFNTQADRFDINKIYKEFAKKYANFPIYRVEIKPYEAYVAPTEYIIHDGSSWNSSNPDINLVVRGNFFFGKFNFFRKIASYLKFLG